ncbi:MAG: hypothetical protein ABL903_18395 [Methylococcales bacterium]
MKKMRRSVWLPLVGLGESRKNQLFEISSEPNVGCRIDLRGLNYLGLSENAQEVLSIMEQLNYSPQGIKLSLNSAPVNLVYTEGITLGLLCACFMQEPSCLLQSIIVTGYLQKDKNKLLISSKIYFENQLKALLESGLQSKPVSFFLPRAAIKKRHSSLLWELENNNIVLQPVDSLKEIMHFLGIDSNFKERSHHD